MNRWRTPMVAAGLLAASVPVLRRTSDRGAVPGLVAAHALRLGAGVLVMRTIDARYAGMSDVYDYHDAGLEIAPRLRQANLGEALTLARTVPFDTQIRWPLSTNLVRLLTGGVYATFGRSMTSGFLVSSSVGFWGTWCFRQAFAVALPNGRQDSYTRLVFCWPSILFWTSALGKESWMTLSFGTGALGMAHLVKGHVRRGMTLGALGAGLTAALRPNVASYLKRRPASPPAAIRNEPGAGSAFAPPELRSLHDLPAVAASVVFRPYIWEAKGAQVLATALEGTALMVLSVARARRALPALLAARRQPYVGFVLGSLAVSVVLLSPLGNFGLLARERSPLLPFYMMLLCVEPD